MDLPDEKRLREGDCQNDRRTAIGIRQLGHHSSMSMKLESESDPTQTGGVGSTLGEGDVGYTTFRSLQDFLSVSNHLPSFSCIATDWAISGFHKISLAHQGCAAFDRISLLLEGAEREISVSQPF